MRHLGLALSLGLALAASGALAQHRAHESSVPSHSGHAHGPANQPSDTPSTRGYKAAHGAMMRAMAVPYTGDPDVDFRLQMIPHHQGAIDMAKVAMQHAKDPWSRQLAEAIIVEQQREIAQMRGWLASHGVTSPTAGDPTHIMGADSYRSLMAEAGTRTEAAGQSSVPGSGVPNAVLGGGRTRQ